MMSGPDESNVVILFAFGTSAMLMMVVGVVLFIVFYQKKMLQEQVNRQLMEAGHRQKMMEVEMQSRENERGRLSREIHDGVGVMLQALRATTMAVAKNASEDDRHELGEQINEITETVRRMAYDLMPASLEKFGLTETLDELCTRLNRFNQRTQFIFFSEGTEQTLDSWQQLLLYRMVQEATNNAIRHAQATEIRITMNWNTTALLLSVADNGKGFDFPEKENEILGRHGLGLYSLENRSNLLGSEIKFQANKPHGTLLNIYLPLNG
jgi:two-component system NarL family sensor kinase